MPLTKRRSE